MKILCNNASLCGAVTNVSKAVSERAALKSLEGIKFKLENSVLELTGYDLEIGIKTVIPVKSDDSGEFILNAKLFSEMIRKMPSEEILIEVSENFQVTISGGVTTFNIPATSAEEYPALPKKEEENKITISQPVLKDMIKSEFCNVVKLSRIFRQAAESQIVTNAHKINAGEQIKLDNKNMDFFHLERNNSQDVINVTIQLIMKNLPPYVDATSYDIQVLTPMRKGELGVENLNKVLQAYMNPKMQGKNEHEFHGVVFRENDKVMQIKNNYQIKWQKKNRFDDVIDEGTGVFNGDTGIIKQIIEAAEIVYVEYEEGKIVEYGFGDMDEMELAYAITIHKSQGSEYPAVILPIISGPRMLLNRNLLYTAVTRAKKCVTIVGSADTIRKMIQNVNEQKRYSTLCRRIIEMEEYK